jgi:hypothetical protein
MLATATKGNGHTTGRQQAVIPTKTVTSSPPVPDVDRHAAIALEAYYAAERRGFKGGSAQEDWLAAETKIGK